MIAPLIFWTYSCCFASSSMFDAWFIRPRSRYDPPQSYDTRGLRLGISGSWAARGSPIPWMPFLRLLLFLDHLQVEVPVFGCAPFIRTCQSLISGRNHHQTWQSQKGQILTFTDFSWQPSAYRWRWIRLWRLRDRRGNFYRSCSWLSSSSPRGRSSTGFSEPSPGG